MARINLLPWRAERRKQREREFYLMLGAAAVAAIVAFGAAMLWMDARIENQNGRNTFLQEEIKKVDKQIEEIKELDKTKSRLLTRKQVIEQLQANRSQMVHLFDELVRTIPEGVRLTQIKQSNDTLTLEGVAQSNASVASYMRNLEASKWMGRADLKKTEAKRDEKRMPYVFSLDVKLRKPADAENAEDAGSVPADAVTPATAAPAAPAAPKPPAPAATHAQGEAP